MRNHFVCDSFGSSVRGVSFGYGDQTRIFGHNHASHWQGPRGHRYHKHGYQHHGHGHRPHGRRLYCHGLQSNRTHNQEAPCNRFRGHGLHVYGHHGHGPHNHRLRPHSHGCHTNGDLFHKPHGFWPPHHLNMMCKPHHFWESISVSKGPHQYRRRRCEEEKQGSNRGHHANLHNVTPRPHSV